MSVEILSSSQDSSDFSNGTQDLNYFMICIDQPIGPLFWAGYSAVCFLLGFPASVMVLRELCLRHPQNISKYLFVFSQTFIDIAFLSVLLFSVANYMVWHNFKFEWLCNFMYSLTVSGRPLFMACVCGEYYFAVVHPIIYKTSKRVAMIRKSITMTVWLIIVCFGLLAALYPWIFTTAFASIPIFIALPVIGFCDISVFRALRKADPSGKINVHPQKKRALRTIINSFVMTFTVYLPPSVIFAVGYNTQFSYEWYDCVINILAVCFTVSGCVIMPYLESAGRLNIQKIVMKINTIVRMKQIMTK